MPGNGRVRRLLRFSLADGKRRKSRKPAPLPSSACVNRGAPPRLLNREMRRNVSGWSHPHNGSMSIQQEVVPVTQSSWARFLHRSPLTLDQEKVRPWLAGKRILVTGAGGWIGSALTRAMVEFTPEHLMLLEAAERNLYELQLALQDSPVSMGKTYVLGSVSDPILLEDPALATRIRALRNQGRYPSDDWFQHTELGYNYRISEINCALGLAQMKRLEEILNKREAVASAYDQRLRSHAELTLPALSVPGGRISWFVYVVRVGSGLNRDAIVEGLSAAGIGSGRYFAPIHQQPSYAAWRTSARVAVTEAEASRTLALPFFNQIDVSAIDEICHSLVGMLQGQRC